MQKVTLFVFLLFCVLLIQQSLCFSNETILASISLPCTPQCVSPYICNNGTCTRCAVDSDCGNLMYYKCVVQDAEKGTTICKFKSLFLAPNAYEICAFVLCFFVAILAATSGVGGGSLFVPAMIIIGGMPSNLAPVFSQVLIFGSMGTNFLIFFFQKGPSQKPKRKPKKTEMKALPMSPDAHHSLPDHSYDKAAKDLSSEHPAPKTKKFPNPIKICTNFWVNYAKDYFTKRPMVQFDYFCVFQPASLAGTVVGVLLNSILPDWCVLAMLSWFCWYTVNTSYKKGMSLRKKFIAKRKEKKAAKEKKLKEEKEKEKELADQKQEVVTQSNENLAPLTVTTSPAAPQIPAIQITNLSPFSKTPSPLVESDHENDHDHLTSSPISPQKSLSDNNLSAMSPISGSSGDLSNQDTSFNAEITLVGEHAKNKDGKERIMKIILAAFDFDSNLNIPVHKLLFLLIGWIIVFCASLVKGSKKAPSLFNIPTCSPIWWIVTVALFFILFPMSYAYSSLLMLKFYTQRRIAKYFKNKKEHKDDGNSDPNAKETDKNLKTNLKIEHDHEIDDEEEDEDVAHYLAKAPGYDVDFTLRKTITMPLYGFLSGAVGATLGIGGGMVIVPIMNAMGVDPQVAASTSSSMIFSTSAATIMQFMIFGLLPYDYFLALCLTAAAGCLIGQFGVGQVVKRSGRTYLVTFLLCIMVFFSLFLTIFQTLNAAYHGIVYKKDYYSGLSSPCD